MGKFCSKCCFKGKSTNELQASAKSLNFDKSGTNENKNVIKKDNTDNAEENKIKSCQEIYSIPADSRKW